MHASVHLAVKKVCNVLKKLISFFLSIGHARRHWGCFVGIGGLHIVMECSILSQIPPTVLSAPSRCSCQIGLMAGRHNACSGKLDALYITVTHGGCRALPNLFSLFHKSRDFSFPLCSTLEKAPFCIRNIDEFHQSRAMFLLGFGENCTGSLPGTKVVLRPPSSIDGEGDSE